MKTGPGETIGKTRAVAQAFSFTVSMLALTGSGCAGKFLQRTVN